MDEVKHVKVDSPQGLVDAMNALVDSIEAATAKAGRFSALYCQDVVSRNGRLASMKLEREATDIKARIDEEILNSAGHNQNVHEELEHFATEINTHSWTLKGIRDFFVKIWNEQNKHLKAVQSNLGQATAKLERLREHALHRSETRDAVWAITDGKCFYCDISLVRSASDCASQEDSPRIFHIDHLVAKDCGGPDHLSNYVPACQREGARHGGEVPRTM